MSVRGPLFNGRAEIAVQEAVDEAAVEVAKRGVFLLRSRMNTKFQHQTGKYISKLRISGRFGNQVINDGASKYGPWLEGTGSRNAPHTRFRGYASFKAVTTNLNREAQPIADRIVHKHLKEMQ